MCIKCIYLIQVLPPLNSNSSFANMRYMHQFYDQTKILRLPLKQPKRDLPTYINSYVLFSFSEYTSSCVFTI